MVVRRTAILPAALMICVLAAGVQPAMAQNVQVTFDGAPMAFTEPALMWDMLFPLLPAESFIGSLGATPTWDADDGRLDVDLMGVHLEMWVGSQWVTLNDRRETMEYGLQTLSGVPYVPGPATARLLGFEATWDAGALTLAITSPVTATAESTVAATLLAPPGREVPVMLSIREADGGAVREVPLDQRATSARGRHGQQPVVATVDDLQPGDLLEIGLTRQGVGIGVQASYNQEMGTIASIQNNQLVVQGGGSYPLGEGITAVGSDGGALHVLGAVGEAAILRLNPNTNEVWGIFSQRRGNPVPPDGGAAVVAGFFAPRYDGPLAVGDTLDLRLLASAGGTVTVPLPLGGPQVPLDETAPGVYTATYTIAEGVEFAGARLMAQYRSPAGQFINAPTNMEVMVDPSAPRIYNITPPPDSVVEPVQPRITANFQDQGPSGIDIESAAIRLDGQDISPRAEVTETGLVRVPDRLRPGRHTVSIEVSDFAGNTAVETWSFRAQAPGAQIVGVQHDAAQPLQPGDTITVTATVAAAGRRATFDIGDIVHGVAMQLQPGTTTYRGSYTVRQGDVAENAQVTVHFTDPGGTVHDAVVEARVTIVAPPEPEVAFAITSPGQGEETGRRVTPAGTAPAGQRVQWVIAYRKLILGGEVARGTVTVGGDGTWRAAGEVDLKLLLLGMADNYTLTAQLLGDGDQAVAESSVIFTAADR